MTTQDFSRRGILTALVAVASALTLPPAGRAAARGRLYLSARGDAGGGYWATGIRPGHGVAFDVPLPARGHSMALGPDGRTAVFFGRRPGAFALVVDIMDGMPLQRIEAAPGRWFNGHGTFTVDGARLFTSETVAETGDGMIGVYEPSDGYRRAGEWPSGGLDPHDIRLLSDGRTLAVANGGILHHADAPRAILNLDTMAPSLTYLDIRHGELLATVTLPAALHQLSIRHLAVAPGDEVVIAMQYKGPAGDAVPLVGTHRPGTTAIRILNLPAEAARDMRQYCGSAAVDVAGRFLAVTSPRGGTVLFWDLRNDRYAGAHRMADCCGIAACEAPGMFLLSSGYGKITRYDVPTGRADSLGPFADGAKWDNHLMAVRG